MKGEVVQGKKEEGKREKEEAVVAPFHRRRGARGRGPVTRGFSMDKIEWDGKNDAGDLVASGVYVIYLHGRRAYHGKVVVIK